MKRTLKVLVVEGSEADFHATLQVLEKHGYRPQARRVETAAEFSTALEKEGWEAVLFGHRLPGFRPSEALEILRRSQADIPFLVVSRALAWEEAREVVAAGGRDWVLKDRLDRLGVALFRELEAAEARRKQWEREETFCRWRKAVETADAAAGLVRWSCDLSRGEVVFHGLGRLELAGEEKGETLSLRRWFELIHPEDRPGVEAAISAHLRRHLSYLEFEHRLPGPDASWRWFWARGRIGSGEENQPARAAGICLDITDEVLLLRRRVQAEKLDLLARLCGGLAHDFNNVLSVVMSYLSVLKPYAERDPLLAADLGKIKEAADRGAELTRRLLFVSGRHLCLPKIIDLNEFFRGRCEELARLAGAGVELHLVLDPSGGKVFIDAELMMVVVRSLVENAVAAMAGEGELRIETANVKVEEGVRPGAVPPGSYVLVKISDTGPGMTPQVLAHLFEPSLSQPVKGRQLGLGLAVVYSIVTQSSGHIEVESELGKGTTVKVFLPRQENPPPGKGGRQKKNQQSRPTVLVVEESEMMRRAVCRLLLEEGYEILYASSGKEAVELFEKSPPKIDLLLTNLVMPDMSGRQLAAVLGAARPEMKVLYLSGWGMRSRTKWDPSKVNFIHKPAPLEEILTKVKELLPGPS